MHFWNTNANISIQKEPPLPRGLLTVASHALIHACIPSVSSIQKLPCCRALAFPRPLCWDLTGSKRRALKILLGFITSPLSLTPFPKPGPSVYKTREAFCRMFPQQWDNPHCVLIHLNLLGVFFWWGRSCCFPLSLKLARWLKVSVYFYFGVLSKSKRPSSSSLWGSS